MPRGKKPVKNKERAMELLKIKINSALEDEKIVKNNLKEKAKLVLETVVKRLEHIITHKIVLQTIV